MLRGNAGIIQADKVKKNKTNKSRSHPLWTSLDCKGIKLINLSLRYLEERERWKKGRITQILHINPRDLCDCHGALGSTGKPIYDQCVSVVTEPFPYQCRELLSSTILMLMKISFSFLISFTQHINHEMGPFFLYIFVPPPFTTPFPLCIFFLYSCENQRYCGNQCRINGNSWDFAGYLRNQSSGRVVTSSELPLIYQVSWRFILLKLWTISDQIYHFLK